MKNTQSICIAGKNKIAIKALYFLIKNYNKNIFFLPNVSDTGKDTWQPSFKKFAESAGVRLISESEIYENENLIFISLEYEKIINVNKFRSKHLFNIHFSLLPKYKGMYTSTIPILKGEKYTGVTLHKIDSGIDTGNIISQIKFKIKKNWNAQDLYERYLFYGYQIFKKNIKNIIKKKIKSLQQPIWNSSYFSKSYIDFKNINIDFNKTAFEIHNQFRGFTFRPFQMPSFAKCKIYKSKILRSRSRYKPGKIVYQNKKYFRVSSIDYDIILYKDHYPKFWNYLKKGNLKNLKKISKYIENLDEKNEYGKKAYEIAKDNNQLNLYKSLIIFKKKFLFLDKKTK